MTKKVKKVISKEVTDLELVEQIKKGSEDAFDTIVNKYESKLFNLAMSFTRNQEDAEEVIQDVFVTLFRKIGSFQGKSAFSSWLYRITVNAAFMRLRKNRQEKSTPVEDITPAMEMENGELDKNSFPSSETITLNDELKTILYGAVSRLPDEYRNVFILRDVDGLSNKETGKILTLSIPAVKSRLHRARLMLRKKLQRYYDEYSNPSKIVGIAPRYMQELG
ncbi:MAG: sigma-70 family RNA polymerase sigma factor [bacterium]|nr:sigma-70 family RNA polymerase sigma factor [bacterium]